MRLGDSLNFSACRAVLLFSLIPLASAQQYTISTVAGIGRLPFVGAGGSAVSAPLVEPFAVAADSSGNVYVSDQYFHQVFRISASHTANPVIERIGNIKCSGGGFGFRIRRIAANGTIADVAGSTNGFGGDGGNALSAKLLSPLGLAADGCPIVWAAAIGFGQQR